jgi:hypothetical protein
MLRKFTKKLLLHILVPAMFGALLLSACTKHEVYSVVPHIEYKSLEKIPTSTGVDDKAYLTITFTDGDGDIGLRPDDTMPPYNPGGKYYYNFIIDYFEKQGDTFVKIDLPITNNSRIPYVEANLAERGVKGEIQIELFINNIMSTADSIRYEMYIYDRKLHKSNVVTTPSIYVKKQP